MFAASGATSLGIVKTMQKEGLVAPGRYKNSSGKLSRAWEFADILRIALAVELAHETGFNLQVAVVILGALGKDLIDFALSTQETQEKIRDTLEKTCAATTEVDSRGLPAGWSQTEVLFHRPDFIDIQIVDRELVYKIQLNEDDRDVLEQSPLGFLVDARSSAPRLEPMGERGLPVHYEDERSNLVVHLNCLAYHPLNVALGVKALLNPWVR